MTTATDLCPMCAIEAIDDQPDHTLHERLLAHATPDELADLDRAAAACRTRRGRSLTDEWVRAVQPIFVTLGRRREARAQADHLARLRAEVATFIDVDAITPDRARLLVDYCHATGLVDLDQPSY